MFVKKPIGFRDYKDFRHQFETELVYTRRDLSEALKEQEKKFVVNRIIQQGKDVNIALGIVKIIQGPEGITVYVR